MNRILVLIILSLTHCAEAYAEAGTYCWKPGRVGLLEPQEMYMDVYKYDSLHDPYLYPVDNELYWGANFKTKFNVVRYKGFAFYADSLLHFDQSEVSGQVKHAGWQYELGVNVARVGLGGIDIFRQHHSRHILEGTRERHFPVYDRTGVRFWFFNANMK